MDALIAEKVMGWTMHRDLIDKSNPIARGFARGGSWDSAEWCPKYSTDIAAAWEVFQTACGWLFSKRRRFFHDLQREAALEDGSLVAWPDVLARLCDRFPLAVCRAALRTMEAGQ